MWHIHAESTLKCSSGNEGVDSLYYKSQRAHGENGDQTLFLKPQFYRSDLVRWITRVQRKTLNASTVLYRSVAAGAFNLLTRRSSNIKVKK